MKVCMISGTYPPLHCGIGDHAASLAQHLVGLGAEVDVLTCRSNPAPRHTANRVRETVNVFPILSQTPALDAVKIAVHVAEQHCDIIHLQFPSWAYRRSLSISLLPPLLRPITRVPLVATLHEVVRSHPINRLRLVPIAYAASAVIGTTEEDCAWLARALPAMKHRVTHVPIGPSIEPTDSPPQDRSYHRRRLGIKPDDIAICHFGFLLRNKMVEDLLAAVRNVAESGVPVRLVFMSGFEHTEGSYGAFIRGRIRELGIEPIVTETGYLPPAEASGCFLACDLAAMLFRDGASFRRSSILAAMTHGLPMVSCRSGAVPAGIVDGENIILSPVGDVAALSANLLKLCKDPALRLMLAQGSLKTARQFSATAIARRTIDLYHTLL